MDIANSQPLIAYLLIEEYWSKKFETKETVAENLPNDVLQYKKDCEAGDFYNNFMNELQVPEELRSQFKADFFAKVFFSEHNGWKDMLKDLFIERYPSCWEAICESKGGLHSKEYMKFSIKLQEKEAQIIFDTVNVGLLNAGIKAFNIFDAIYVNNMEDYEKARQLTINAFKLHGLSPKVNLKIYDEKEKAAEKEMTKRYTVDGFLSSKIKSEKEFVTNTPPTKLQHLKIGDKSSKMADNERIVQGIKEQDEGEERIMNSIPQNEKEINDLVVALLKADGHAINTENIDYLTRVVRGELKLKDVVIEKPEPSGFRYVNPYVKKSA